MNKQLQHAICLIEQNISAYYDFELLTSANEYIVSRQHLRQLVANVDGYPEWLALGAVWFEDRQQTDEVFIAIHLDQKLAKVFQRGESPLNKLNDDNISNFCVLIEEVSHFHLLANKAAQGITLSKLELELQGEIDKVIVCANLLHKQTGCCHLSPLVRKICDATHVANAFYEQATIYAAKFFACFLQRGHAAHTHNVLLRRCLQRYYLSPWQQKRQSLFNPVFY